MHQIQDMYFQAHCSSIHSFNHLELVTHFPRYAMFACMQVSSSLSIECNVYAYPDLYGAKPLRAQEIRHRIFIVGT